MRCSLNLQKTVLIYSYTIEKEREKNIQGQKLESKSKKSIPALKKYEKTNILQILFIFKFTGKNPDAWQTSTQTLSSILSTTLLLQITFIWLTFAEFLYFFF